MLQNESALPAEAAVAASGLRGPTPAEREVRQSPPFDRNGACGVRVGVARLEWSWSNKVEVGVRLGLELVGVGVARLELRKKLTSLNG